MKTYQVMTRHMGQFKVQQRTTDGFFNATALLEQWNETKGVKKDINDFIEQEDEFCSWFFDTAKELYSYRKVEDGALWLNEPSFYDFLDFLSQGLKIDLLESSVFGKLFDRISVFTKKERKYNTYIIKDSSGLYKIGKSINIRKRLNDLSTGNPSIKICMIIKEDVEGLLHRFYKKRRVFREWFSLTDEDIHYLRKKYSEKCYPKVFLT